MDDVAPVTIKGVCMDPAGRVLLCRNDRAQWELPGGRPDPGEQFAACVRREIAEETGLSAEVQELIAAYPFEVLPRRWVTVIVYGCEITELLPLVVSEEHEHVAFVDPSELDGLELPDGYRQAIDTWIGVR